MRKLLGPLVLLALTAPTPATGQTLRGLTFEPPKMDTLRDPTTKATKEIVKTYGTYTVFADGSVKDVLGGKKPTSIGTGSLGLSIQTESYSFSIVINALGKAEAIKEDHGASVLAPASGSGLNSGLVEFRRRIRGKPEGLCNASGVRTHLSVSSANWRAATGPDTSTYGVTTPGFGLGVFCDVLNYEHAVSSTEKRKMAISLDAGFVQRIIAGNIALDANDAIRETILLTGSRWFPGFEAGASIRVNGVKAGLTSYWFKRQTPGFSRGQVVAGISIESPLFQGPLTRTVTVP